MQLALPQRTFSISPYWVIFYLLFTSICLDIGVGAIIYAGLPPIPVSMLYRAVIFAVFVIVLMRYNDFHSNYCKFMLVVWCLCFCFWLLSFGGSKNLMLEINHFTRALFPMCITGLVYSTLQKAKADSKGVADFVVSGLLFYGTISAGFIVFSAITGIGENTYGPWAFGFKSFFVGGNDIGLAMLLCLTLAWALLWQHEKLRFGFYVLLITIGISLIGSRAAWGGVAGITICFTFGFLLFKQSKRKLTYAIKVVILTISLVVSGTAAKLIYDNLEALAVTIERVTELLDGVSPRERLERAGHHVIENRDPVYNVFGQGIKFYYEVQEQFSLHNRSIGEGPRHQKMIFKYIEQDPFDLYGTYGAFLGLIILGYHLFFWLWSIKLFFQHKNVTFFSYCLGFTIFIFHGAVAGHALISPQVGSVVGGMYALMWYQANLHRRKRANANTATELN